MGKNKENKRSTDNDYHFYTILVFYENLNTGLNIPSFSLEAKK